MIRVIKRYESRKLYDTEESRYISLEDISSWVREGQEVQVIDNASADDVTAQILTQIILEEGRRGTGFLPTELLHELVRGGERLLSSGVEQVQGGVDRLVRASIDRLSPVREAREEMVHLRERLAGLERTLERLETETASDSMSRGNASKAASGRSASRPKASAKRRTKKPPAKKPTASDAAAS